jgi:hypothetical protein
MILLCQELPCFVNADDTDYDIIKTINLFKIIRRIIFGNGFRLWDSIYLLTVFEIAYPL